MNSTLNLFMLFKKHLISEILVLLFISFISSIPIHAQRALVLQSDFGLSDNAVASMKGVAFGVSSEIKIFDSTHDITPFNIWEAAYRLDQTAIFWPEGTVFVSVVDPGVGTDRKSVVLKTESGHYFVTPDNGTLTLVAKSLGIDEVREIDEAKNRLAKSDKSYTFHGRDVYAYTGARLASGTITFEEVGSKLPAEVKMIDHPEPEYQNSTISGYIPILDVRYGNVWTNITRDLFSRINAEFGDHLTVTISNNDEIKFQGDVPYHRSFGEVSTGEPLLYFNSLENLSIALNQDDFAGKYGINPGPDWKIKISRK